MADHLQRPGCAQFLDAGMPPRLVNCHISLEFDTELGHHGSWSGLDFQHWAFIEWIEMQGNCRGKITFGSEEFFYLAMGPAHESCAGGFIRQRCNRQPEVRCQ